MFEEFGPRIRIVPPSLAGYCGYRYLVCGREIAVLLIKNVLNTNSAMTLNLVIPAEGRPDLTVPSDSTFSL